MPESLIQIDFEDGLSIQLSVNAEILLTMLELCPHGQGVRFRPGMRFNVRDEAGSQSLRRSAAIRLLQAA